MRAVWVVSSLLRSRGATGILGKAILPSVGLSGASGSQAPRTK